MKKFLSILLSVLLSLSLLVLTSACGGNDDPPAGGGGGGGSSDINPENDPVGSDLDWKYIG